MKILKALGIIAIVLVVLFFGVAMFLPASVHVERSLVIPASRKVVFNQVNDLRNWKHWSPWYQMDPDMQVTYRGFLRGEGASYSWKSDKVGNGTLTITESHPYQYIATQLDFVKKGQATGFYRFEQVADGTRLTWGFETDVSNNPIEKYVGLMIDRMVGDDFEKGLQNLKTHVQSIPGEMVTEDTSNH